MTCFQSVANTMGASIAFLPLIIAVTLAGIAGLGAHYARYKDFRE